MIAPLQFTLRPAATQSAAPATTTGGTVRQRGSVTDLSVFLNVSAIGDLTQAADTLDVYVDASNDGGSTWYNIGRFARVTGVDSDYAVGTLTSTGAITSGVHAETVITSDTTNVSDAETVTIGSTVYRFKDTLALAYDVKIGASAAATLDNLKAAINASGTPGTEYFTGTLAHPTVIATTNTDTTQKIVARLHGTAANATATTETSAHLAWEATTLGAGTGASVAGVAGQTVTIGTVTYTFVTALSETSGAAAVLNQVLYGGSVTAAFANLKKAINHEATEGTQYSTGTVANPDATALSSDATTVALRAVTIGTPGNSVATTETMTNGAFGAVTLTGGTYGPGVLINQVLKWSSSLVEASQPVNLTSDISNTAGAIRQVGFGNAMRYRAVVAGSTPDFTFSVIGVGK